MRFAPAIITVFIVVASISVGASAAWFIAHLDARSTDALAVLVELLVITGIIGTGVFFVWRSIARENDANRTESRLERGQCHACGYSLHANISGKCPECGETIRRYKRFD